MLLCIVSVVCSAQNTGVQQDANILQQYATKYTKHAESPTNELLVLTGKYFLGKPYTAATLEQEGEEQLVVNLREFDCTTFVETCLALSYALQSDDTESIENYMDILKDIRYRNGVIDGYASRLHYPSDWLYENSDRLENITLRLGGKVVDKPLTFMSLHSRLYSHLKENKENQEKIRQVEQAINSRKNYTLLPVSKIQQAEKKIRTGDIIIFGANVPGLDYSHIGIAFWENNILKLLHASSARKKVVVDSKSLVQYCTASKTCTGITVLRIKDN